MLEDTVDTVEKRMMADLEEFRRQKGNDSTVMPARFWSASRLIVGKSRWILGESLHFWRGGPRLHLPWARRAPLQIQEAQRRHHPDEARRIP